MGSRYAKCWMGFPKVVKRGLLGLPKGRIKIWRKYSIEIIDDATAPRARDESARLNESFFSSKLIRRKEKMSSTTTGIDCMKESNLL